MTFGLFLWLLVPVSLAGFSAWRLSQYSEAVYRDLDAIWTRARAAESMAQLVLLRAELVDFHRNRCHVRHYGDYARRVLAYIDGRIEAAARPQQKD